MSAAVELVVLDMAGTTIDDGGAVYRALRECVEAHGVEVPDDRLQEWMGTDKRAAISALVGGLSTPELVESSYEDFRSRLARAYAAEPPTPIPGVVEAFGRLRAAGVKVVLSTGFARDVVTPLLAAVCWTPGTPDAPIDGYVCSDDVPAGRPAPYMVHRAMAMTGVLTASAVAVAGDTHVDLEAGTNAAAGYVVGVLTGALDAEALGRERHTHILRSVAELPELVLG